MTQPNATTPRRIGYGVGALVGVFGLGAAAMGVFAVLVPLVVFRPRPEGTPLGVDGARRLLAANPVGLAEVRALGNAPGTLNEKEREGLAKRIGALRVETTTCGDGVAAIATFYCTGTVGEAYYDQLHWLTPDAVKSVNAGLRLGEEQQALGDGWYWVWF
jgi:hypothetical protein